MQLKTILNRLERHRSFVYGDARFVDDLDEPAIEIAIRPRSNGRPTCSGCGQRRAGYDSLPERRFRHVPLWGLPVFFRYRRRRVHCPQCGVVAEAIPWATGNSQSTTSFAWFLAGWAKKLSWTDVAKSFRTSWDTVFRSVHMAVAWGRHHQVLAGIAAIGVDEIAWQRGHKYLTLVYQLDGQRRRLLWIGEERTTETIARFFDWLGQKRSRALRFICSDMWRPYLNVIAQRAGQAIHVLDRFHIMATLSKAIDQVRAAEARELKAGGYEPVLKGSRWLLLKRPENLTTYQAVKLADLVRFNLRTVRAYLLKEELNLLWHYVSPQWARHFLRGWCYRAMRSRIEPMKKVARSLRLPERRTDSAASKPSKLPSITLSETYPSPREPTNTAEEAKL